MTGRGLLLASVCAALLGCRVQTRLTPPVGPPARSTAPRCPTLPLGEELPAPDGGYGGRTIARVCLLGASLETRATAERSLQVLTGQPVDARRVREDLAILHGLGRYDDVAAYGMEAERGLLLLYVVRERPRIAAFELTGAEGFVDIGLLAAFAVNRWLDIRGLHALGRSLLDRCREAGHVECQVDHEVAPTQPAKDAASHVVGSAGDGGEHSGHVRVAVTVRPGPVSRIGGVAFRGARHVPRAELVAAAGLRAGGPLVRARLDEAVARVRARYHASGRLDAKVTLAAGPRAADGAVALTFEVAEGAVYTFAGLHVTGSAAAEERRLLTEVVALRVGRPYARGAVAEDVDRIKVHFESRGEPVSVTPRVVRDGARATIDLSFEVSRQAR